MLASRLRMIAEYVRERRRYGTPALTGDPGNGTVFLLDGVGGYLLTCLMARKAFREAGLSCATYLFDWHRGPRGEMLGDLVCLRRNQLAAARLARLIRRFRRAYPDAPLHILAYSGGTGIAVFAAERLNERARIDTLVLCCSALSPEYPLARAMQHVDRCYAFVSERDRVMLGIGTRLFGTVDREHCPAAGLTGFRCLRGHGRSDSSWQARVQEIRWTADMRADGHYGGHVGTASPTFIARRIVPLLITPRHVPSPSATPSSRP
ncbi:MAG TPA: hypothetical protein PLC79_03505 [Phycisphaerae bacterium]|nr:hypothetical protein [Phycisphaerae bacterium]